MKRLINIDDVKKATMLIHRKSTDEEMKKAKSSFRSIFLNVQPESLEYMLGEYNSFIGFENEEKLIKLGNDPNVALETVTLLSHMASLYKTAEEETGKWFPFVDFIAALNRQIQNLDIVLIETESGFCVIRRTNYCIIRNH
ncbi:MAG: hypothetical protein KAH01_00915 [Caldisericia bacterium]|nr:hypothetical protein [Caldisericia bacterium]